MGMTRESAIDFYGGAVIFGEGEAQGVKGDVDLDGEPYRPADLALLGQHCLAGDDVFQVDVQRQLEASDIDEDGLGGTVADWVALRYLVAGAGPSEAARSPSPVAHFELVRGDRSTAVFIDAESSANAFAIWFAVPVGGIDSVAFVQSYDVGALEAALAIIQDTLARVAYSAGSLEDPAISAGYTHLLTIYHQSGVTLETTHLEASTNEPRLFEVDIATEVKDREQATDIPSTFVLRQNYPNPFNPGTTIQFNLARPASWSLEIFSPTGRRVREFSGRSGAGAVCVYWDGREREGAKSASGLYFYRVTVERVQQTRKMVLLR